MLSLAIASILYNKIRGWRFYRSVIFIPYILAIPVCGHCIFIFTAVQRVINSILRTIGLENMALDWLGDPNLAFPSVAIVIMWEADRFQELFCFGENDVNR